MPLADAFELVRTAVYERERSTRHELLDRARDEHLVGLGLGGDTRGGVNSDTNELSVRLFAFARVKAGPHFDPQLANGIADAASTADPTCRPVEGRKEAVAGGVDLPAAETSQLPANQRGGR